MNKWFEGVTTVEELRKKYRELLKIHHPDNGGNVSDMQSINAEYDALFDELSKYRTSDTQSYTKEENEQFKAILNEIIGFNITIEVIGSWIWCFDCYAYKDQLKILGFTWCSKKKAWTWHSGEYRRHHKKEIPLNDIRTKYGSQTVRNQAYQYSIS